MRRDPSMLTARRLLVALLIAMLSLFTVGCGGGDDDDDGVEQEDGGDEGDGEEDD
jgi:hypothetical protein